MTFEDKMTGWLFSSKAVSVCEPDQPYWYTSGTLGPFYINTHFLYGGEAAANQLLALIENLLGTPEKLPRAVSEAVARQYLDDPRYREICDGLADKISGHPCDIVSGGERRDFFFSVQAAILTGKPHLAIMKDGRAFLGGFGDDDARLVADGELSVSRIIHVVDIVTEASSFKRAWTPAIRRCGGTLAAGLAVLDRNQGGGEVLRSAGADLMSLAVIGKPLFDRALSDGLIRWEQYDMIVRFLSDPHQFMNAFIDEHPGFLDSQIAMGGKNRERALLYLQNKMNP